MLDPPRPMLDLLSTTDVAEVLGVSRQRVYELSKKEGFPLPLGRTSSGLIYERKPIEEYAATRRKTPGRPRKRVSSPVWLLDIDGVVNAASGTKPPTHVWPRKSWTNKKINGFSIWVAAEVADFIREVHENGLAEIRWHTTWQTDAQKISDEFNLPTFSVQHAPEYELYTRDAKGWWKLPAAQRVLQEEGRKLLWTDDDAGWALGLTEDLKLRGMGVVEIVSPDPMTGLCQKHLRQIDRFLKEV